MPKIVGGRRYDPRVTDETEREHGRAVAAGDEAAWAALVRERALALGSSAWLAIGRTDPGASAAERAGWRRIAFEPREGDRVFAYGVPVTTVDDIARLSLEVPGSVVVDAMSGLKLSVSLACGTPILLDEAWPDEFTAPPRILPIGKPERSLIGLAKSNYDTAVRLNKQKLEKSLEAARVAKLEVDEALAAYVAALHGVYASRGYPRLPRGTIDLTDDGLVYEREGT